MSKPMQRKSYKNKTKLNNCEYCDECQYIGEGDFACMRKEIEKALNKSIEVSIDIEKSINKNTMMFGG